MSDITDEYLSTEGKKYQEVWIKIGNLIIEKMKKGEKDWVTSLLNNWNDGKIKVGIKEGPEAIAGKVTEKLKQKHHIILNIKDVFDKIFKQDDILENKEKFQLIDGGPESNAQKEFIKYGLMENSAEPITLLVKKHWEGKENEFKKKKIDMVIFILKQWIKETISYYAMLYTHNEGKEDTNANTIESTRKEVKERENEYIEYVKKIFPPSDAKDKLNALGLEKYIGDKNAEGKFLRAWNMQDLDDGNWVELNKLASIHFNELSSVAKKEGGKSRRRKRRTRRGGKSRRRKRRTKRGGKSRRRRKRRTRRRRRRR